MINANLQTCLFPAITPPLQQFIFLLMCGITGIYNINSRGSITVDTLNRMVRVLHHRGPDESGIYIDDHVGLGHARLSIIDLAGGSQPIHNEDQTLWIIYNGEVFNYPELKTELLKKGHRFYTASDTEAVLHLFEERGPACVQELNGQFAFAIWNSTKKELFLARDRVGIRPLHYTCQNGCFYFASEIKSLFIVPEINRELDPTALDQIFTFWTTLPGRTAFRNIHELKPGCFLQVTQHSFSEQQYWHIPYYPKNEHLSLSPDEISEQVRELLYDAVRIRLRADVPVGSYLSGGLDSSGITALIAGNFNKNVETFGIRFEEDAFDEGAFQNEMVSFLEVQHHELRANNKKIAQHFPRVIFHCEKPLLRTAPVPLFLLSRVVHDNNLKVVLTGEGADEVFGGYNIFREALVRHFWSRRQDSKARAMLIEQLYPHIFNNPLMKKSLTGFFGQGLDKTQDPLFSHLIRWNNTSRIKKFFSNDCKSAIGDYNCYEEIKATLPENFNERDCLAKAQYLENTLFLSNYLLSSQGDRVAMAHSLEIRVPYLDYRIIDFMAKVPPTWKILGLSEKHILKKAFKGILPESITSRTKHPYRAPIQQSLFCKEMPDYVGEMLSENAVKKAGLFDPGKVSLLYKKVESGKSISETEGMAVAGILSTMLVYSQFIDNWSHGTATPVSPSVFVDRRSG